MRVKLLQVYEAVYNVDYGELIKGAELGDFSDWSDISSKELDVLQLEIAKLNAYRAVWKYVLLVDGALKQNQKLTISDVLQEAQDRAKLELDRQKKKEEAKAKRNATLELKRSERKKKQLEKLKRELGEV